MAVKQSPCVGSLRAVFTVGEVWLRTNKAKTQTSIQQQLFGQILNTWESEKGLTSNSWLTGFNRAYAHVAVGILSYWQSVLVWQKHLGERWVKRYCKTWGVIGWHFKVKYNGFYSSLSQSFLVEGHKLHYAMCSFEDRWQRKCYTCFNLELQILIATHRLHSRLILPICQNLICVYLSVPPLHLDVKDDVY